MVKQSIPNKKMKNSIPKELPSQIILEILSRLPIKTLFHCQLVSKHWPSFISDPHFVNLHLSRSPVSLLLKPFYRNRGSNQLHLVDLQTLHKIRHREAQLKLNPKINFPLLGRQIVNSCNGLLCLCNDNSEIFVCNPILGDYITLPSSIYDRIYYDRTINAFGFSPKTNKYKVIQFGLQRVVESFDPIIEFCTYRDEAKAKIYTIGEGLWRNVESVPYYLTNRSFNSFVNGAVHWLNCAGDSPDFICCFDFCSEQFQVVPEPPEFGLHKEFPDHTRLGVLRDCLSTCDFFSPLRIDIWLMKDYGIKESWSKELVIESGIGKSGNWGSYEPIMVLKGGEILMLINKDVLMLYNPKLGSFKNLNIYGIKSEFYGIAHIPSFVSLKDVAKGESLMAFLQAIENTSLMLEERPNGFSLLVLLPLQESNVRRQRNELTIKHTIIVGNSQVWEEDCLEKLKMLPGVTQGDPLYFVWHGTNQESLQKGGVCGVA
ncbi:hypothetical protein TEA_017847 [Camellia sinensis var. sinensis]|uniref:F-box domain-containing protein n=1 Tax=Camellia sinensis var. sinensis TaxID=542762 RepID=A0A4S4DB52_CAMSN|nr:hypothetical protein TEA_017847 [Camellia sinensis var. sinensis]